MQSEPKTTPKLNLYQVVTDKILILLEGQKLRWNKPWVSLSSDGQQAHNAYSDRAYSGINQILLSISRLTSRYPYNGWMTYNQVLKANGYILPGEWATQVFFHKVFYYDRSGNRFDFEQIRHLSESERQDRGLEKRVFLRYYNVFNLAQTSDLPMSFYEMGENQPNLSEIEKDDRAEGLIQGTSANIVHKQSDKAYYDYREDTVYLPERKQFKGKEAYYETALHEIAHWTGHESRLARKIQNVFGTVEYAKEELVAELCSAFLCADLGFTKVITNNAAYIQDWIKVLKNDNRYIFMAVRLAKAAAEYVKSK